MSDQPRLVGGGDWERVHALLYAFDRHVRDEPDRPLWDILAEIHAEAGIVVAPGFFGEMLCAKELQHARLVLEAVMLHDGRLVERPDQVLRRVCATPGCGGAAVWVHCPSCELDGLSGGDR